MSDTVVYEQFEQGADGVPTGAAGGLPGGGADGLPAGAADGAGAPAPSAPASSETAPAGTEADLRRLSDVPMELSVEIGRTSMTIGETLDLRAGSIVTLDRLAGEPVDLLVNGTPIARGEVLVVDEQFGLRVTQILEGDQPAGAAGGEHDDDQGGESA
jgi:flagellar motor switch protein FliN/FliY